MQNNYLDDALLLEEKSYVLYKGLINKTPHTLAKKLYESLATQETYHIEAIKSFAENKNYSKNKFETLELSIKKLFQSIEPEILSTDLEHLQSLELAIKLEKEGYALYTQAYLSTDNQTDRDFFKFLMDMENEHYEALANLYFYYTENDKWFAEEESKVWNWMNL